ncbi:putative ATPase [Aliivibrio wodanis]|uniref:tRNA(Met) cytidine acetyltransferase TmcA n=1 Tax=Aliivibrio wodanis TaxID=80852 RepID=A0A090K2I2_9GAMM|nr:putative ATPase [Aliivibrio wodanis]
MHSVLSFLNTLSSYAASGYIRYPILLEGSKSWCESLIEAFLVKQSSRFIHIELYGDLTIPGFATFPMKSALKKLGQETDCLVIDISHEFNANAINAVCGTVVGGGLVFFIQSSDSALPLFVRQWLSLFTQQMVHLVESDSNLLLPSKPILNTNDFSELKSGYRSLDQEQAVAAIKKTVTGHSKRPLVMTADRGRGKSSAIGISIAELAMTRNITIGITAPLRVSVDEIFAHAERVALINGAEVSSSKHQLTINKAHIIYISPDELLRNPQNLDLLCVDEAAAIPAPMLLSLAKQYSRMIFSTTINGYEGTGRGFEIKFKQQLLQIRPNYRSIEMKQPIRWNINDPLESWLSSVFLLEHKSKSALIPTNKSLSPLTFQCLSTIELINNVTLAQSVFSLLVSAHYQTSPNDWLSLLTDPSLCCWVGIDIETEELVSCALLSKEGELDIELINDVQYGKRRPKGHLAAVSLSQTLCIDEPGTQSTMRIMRVAVEPCYQQCGIGSQFIKAIEQYYEKNNVDYLSTSFGSTAELNYFWNSLDFQFVRLGISKDKSSGTHSLLAIKPLSKKSTVWLSIAESYFNTEFPEQLLSTFSELAYKDVISLVHGVSKTEVITPLMEKRLHIFISGGLGFELIQYELRWFILSNIRKLSILSEVQQQMVIAKIIQAKEWKEVIQECNLIGRKNAEASVRESIQFMLKNLQCKS